MQHCSESAISVEIEPRSGVVCCRVWLGCVRLRVLADASTACVLTHTYAPAFNHAEVLNTCRSACLTADTADFSRLLQPLHLLCSTALAHTRLSFNLPPHAFQQTQILEGNSFDTVANSCEHKLPQLLFPRHWLSCSMTRRQWTYEDGPCDCHFERRDCLISWQDALKSLRIL